MERCNRMNQILSFQNSANGRKILMKNVRKLGIFLIIFALIFIGEGGWNLYRNLNKKVNIYAPEIVGYRNLEKTSFSVKSKYGIQKIIYAWNNGEETTINKSGEQETTFEIENKIGVNDLLLKIVDSNGNTASYDNIKIAYEEDDGLGAPEDDTNTDLNQDWQTAVENDKTEPVITVTAEKGKIVITASDDIKMSYVTYSWNDGEETRITGLSEDEKTLTAKIDAMKGDNKIKIKAYDKAGNFKEYEKNVHGTDGPKIVVKKDGDKIIANISDEFGITKVEYIFNNEEKTIDNIEGNSYDLSFDLKDGENFVIIRAYEGNVKSEYKGKTTK